MLRRLLLIVMLPLALAACGAKSVWAPDEAVARARYVHDGPPALTLFTMVNNRTGGGAHTSLMINASQRVIFDPAGSVEHSMIPERNDVLFGITPNVAEMYARAHARETHHVVIQHVEVPAEVAELAMRKAMANGPVADAQCALVTSRILSELPGFESIRQTWYPNKLAAQFGALPGVVSTKLVEYDAGDKEKALKEFPLQRSTGESALSLMN